MKRSKGEGVRFAAQESNEAQKERKSQQSSLSILLVNARLSRFTLHHRARDLTGPQFLHLLPSPFTSSLRGALATGQGGPKERQEKWKDEREVCVRARASSQTPWGPPNRIPPLFPFPRSPRGSINYLYTIYYIINCNRVLVRPF